ncbi:MAG TPA: NAD(P)-binding protein, partial [Novosphingobium sp.]|nr:NAD(P)-binding protein [Novosphingobium sp.]
MTSPSSLPVLVSGGGIGGLAAALALVRQGFHVQVFEQAPEIGEIGAGI